MSITFICSPISRIKTSPPFDISPACKTKFDASGIVIKYLSTSLWVIVTGPPFAIWSRKSGMTDPEELITFPNLTIHNFVLSFL